MRYTLDPFEVRDPFGTPLPTPESGKVRTASLMHAAAFTPLHMHGGKTRGVRKHEVRQMMLETDMRSSLLPSSYLQKRWREDVEKRVTMTAKMLKCFEESPGQPSSPPYSEFIEQVRSHLATTADV